MCLTSVSSLCATEAGPSMQIPSVLGSAVSGCLSFSFRDGLLQILLAHSSSSLLFFPHSVSFSEAPSLG